MKLLLAALCGGATATYVNEERLAQIEHIRTQPGVLWQASAKTRFAQSPPGTSESLCGVKGNWSQQVNDAVKSGKMRAFTEESNDALPESFDSAANWPECAKVITDILDQSNCGCCWAFAAAGAASDRACIASGAKILLPLSPQDICFCASDDGCSGGDITSPWDYIQQTGAVTGGQYKGTGPFGNGLCADFSLPHCHHHGPQGDDPYPAEGKPGCPSETSPKCPAQCDATASADHKYFSHDKYSFVQGQVETASGEEQIQRMIKAGGPVETAFTVYSDFENYAGGIYKHVTGDFAGGHAVKMVGWGVEKGVKYWKIANSWNPHWAEHGHFRILRGSNECGIEDSVVGSSGKATWGKKSELKPLEVVV